MSQALGHEPARYATEGDSRVALQCWPLVSIRGSRSHRRVGHWQLRVPRFTATTLPPLFAGLLPNRDHNQALLRSIHLLTPETAGQSIISVFAADPFVEVIGLGRRLAAIGCRHIVNWPTTAQYGEPFCATLDAVHLGPKREFSTLARLEQQQLRISTAVCSESAVADAMALRPETLWVTPSFDLWSNGKLNASTLLERCARIRSQVSVTDAATPIVLMSARRAITAAQAANAGASGLIEF